MSTSLTASGQSRADQVAQLRTDGIDRRESVGTEGQKFLRYSNIEAELLVPIHYSRIPVDEFLCPVPVMVLVQWTCGASGGVMRHMVSHSWIKRAIIEL